MTLREFAQNARDRAAASTDRELLEITRQVRTSGSPATLLGYAQGVRDGVVLALDQVLAEIDREASA